MIKNTVLPNLMAYSISKIKERNNSLFADPSDTETKAYRKFCFALAEGTDQLAGFKRITRDETELWVHASYNPVFNHSGKPVKTAKSAFAITAQKSNGFERGAHIAALHRSQAVVAFTPDGTLHSANANFLDALGCDVEDVTRQTAEAALTAGRVSGDIRSVASGAEERSASVSAISQQGSRAARQAREAARAIS